MPATPRLVVPGYPHHVVHRGHNKQPVFAVERDYERYLCDLALFAPKYRVDVIAYCLMSNHVHLLLVPAADSGLSDLMKRLGGRHTRRFNGAYGRTGTLWESRFYSSVVDRDEYLMTCIRYIELNPVRARIVQDAVRYRWSSACARVARLADHRLALANLPDLPAGEAYRAYLREGIPEQERMRVHDALRTGQPTGSVSFDARLESLTGRRIERRRPGRPRKNKSD